MRVAILKGNGHLDNQIQRLLKYHDIKGDFVESQHKNTLKQYDCVILSQYCDVSNLPVFIEQMILQKTSVVYIASTASIGQLYNVYQDIYFNLVSEVTLEASLPITLNQMAKYLPEIHRLQTENIKISTELETLLLTNKAKRILMDKGLTEEESHQFIQKQAMDLRVSKRRVVNLIIENKIDF